MPDRRPQDVELELWLKDRRREYRRESRTALAYGVLMLAVACLAKWPILRVITGILALWRAFAAYRIIQHQRSLDAIAEAAQRTGEATISRLFNQEATFLRSMLYLYALPLSVGLAAIGGVIWHHARSAPMLVLCLILAVGTFAGARHLTSRKLAEMDALRAQIDPLDSPSQ